MVTFIPLPRARNYFHVALLEINGGLTDRLAPKIQVHYFNDEQ